MEWNLEECPDLDPLLDLAGAGDEAPDLGPDLLEVPPRAFRRAQPRALDVVNAMAPGQPPRDVVAGSAVLGEPIIAEIEDVRDFVWAGRHVVSSTPRTHQRAHESTEVNVRLLDLA